jgi:hypothetical protein
LRLVYKKTLKTPKALFSVNMQKIGMVTLARHVLQELAFHKQLSKTSK